MHIAFFTPLAPLQTALADHSEGLLPYLAQGAKIDLFIDDGYRPTSESIVEHFDIYSYHEFSKRAADYDLTVYVMGNNLSFHGYMHELMCDYPGVVILHDIEFQHYFVDRAFRHGDFAAYEAEMECAYGELGPQAAALALAGQIDRVRGAYSLVERIVDRSRGAIVYNRFAYTDLLVRRPQMRIRQLQYHFYLPSGFPAKPDVQALRKRWGLDKCFIIGSFGLFDSPEKRVEVSLGVFKRFLRIQPDAHYLLVGYHSPEYDIPGMIQAYGLTDSVTLTGWMDTLEFTQHLCVPDIAIHLRYPHIGGTLYTPIRLLGLGQPTILSDIEPLAEFPEGCCAKISPDSYEEETLLETLKYLAGHADVRRQMGENGRQFIYRRHNVAQVAQEHLEFFEQIASSQAKTTEQLTLGVWDGQLVRESAAILASWDVGEDEETLLAPFAEAIASLMGEE